MLKQVSVASNRNSLEKQFATIQKEQQLTREVQLHYSFAVN